MGVGKTGEAKGKFALFSSPLLFESEGKKEDEEERGVEKG